MTLEKTDLQLDANEATIDPPQLKTQAFVTPPPTVRDEAMMEMFSALGEDDGYRRAGQYARTFLHYAVVVFFCFVAAAVITG